MVVYHGTILRHAMDICTNGVDLSKSNRYLDFGKGFYVTPNYEMAKDMANRISEIQKRKKDIKNTFPTVISFEYSENVNLNYKEFNNEDIEWAKFIMANRIFPEIANKLGLKDNNYDLKYDIIIGGTADGNVAGIASDLRYKKISPEEYGLNLSDFLKDDGSSYGTQIVFCTEDALSCIECIKYDII